MAQVSRKYQLQMFEQADANEREFFLKLLKHDVVSAFNFVYCKGLYLHIRLSETAHSIQRLEKHFQKLANN